MKTFILGLVIGLLVIPAAVYVYFATGMAPVATDAQAMPFEKTAARIALDKRVEKEAPKQAPFPATEAVYLQGAHEYMEHCSVCHGTASEKSPLARAMFPHAPQLLQGKGVTDDPAGETFWKTQNGIRLTGMPAFKGHLSDDAMWDIAHLLHDADKLPPNVKAQLQGPVEGAHGGGMAPAAGGQH